MSLIQEALRRQEEESRDAAQPAPKEASAPPSPTPPPAPPAASRKTVPGSSARIATPPPPSMAVADRRGTEKKRSPWPVLALVLVLLALLSSAGLLMYRMLSERRRPKSETASEQVGQGGAFPVAGDSGQEPAPPVDSKSRDGDETTRDALSGKMDREGDSSLPQAASRAEPGDVVQSGGSASEDSGVSGFGGGTQNGTDGMVRSGEAAPDSPDARLNMDLEVAGGKSDMEANAGLVEETAESRGGEPPAPGVADSGASTIQWPRLRITGVLQSSGRGAVIVNNQVIGIGETIMGAKLVAVFRQGGEFLLEGETRAFHVGQGGGAP